MTDTILQTPLVPGTQAGVATVVVEPVAVIAPTGTQVVDEPED